MKTLTKLNKQYPVEYTVRYFSPALVEYLVSEGDPTKAEYVPQSVYFEPNKPIRADYIRNAYNAGEKKMLLNARQILVSELVLAEHASQDEVEELVDTTLLNSFTEYQHSDKAEASNVVKKFIPFE